MMHLRRIPVEGAYNVRDLGGYPTADGAATRWGTLFRSDSLADLTACGWAAIQDRGIKTIIDLRSGAEHETYVVTVPKNISYRHLPLMKQIDDESGRNLIMGGSDISVEAAQDFIKSTCLDYGDMVCANIDQCAQVLDVILAAMGEGGVLFFCSAGKDRTGIVAALVLYLCGVQRDDIVADYMVSAIYDREGIGQRIKEQAEVTGLSTEVLEAVVSTGLQSDSQTMDRLLDDLDAMDVRKLLDEQGFSAEKQRRLAALFCEVEASGEAAVSDKATVCDGAVSVETAHDTDAPHEESVR